MRANEAAKYTNTAIALHWIVAILVLGMLALGWWMIGLPKGEGSVRAYYFNLHKSIGITIGFIVLVRILWRLAHPAPAFPAAMPGWQALAARWVHIGLYVCIVMQPLSGVLSSSFSKYPIKYFGYALPRWVPESNAFKEFFSGVHYAGVIALMALVTIHLLGVLQHLVQDRGAMFRRMWPGPRPLPSDPAPESGVAVTLRGDSSVSPPR